SFPLFGVSFKTTVEVTPDYATGHAAAACDENQCVVWPVVIEKAVAQLAGGYNALNGEWVARALSMVTGDHVHVIQLGWMTYTAAEIRRDLQSQKIVLLQTSNELPDDAKAAGLVEDHAYYVRAMQEEGGQPRLMLHNPWDRRHPSPVPIDAIRRWFGAVTVGSVKGAQTP
ncbi:MAG: C2 family cysteine protease, partial [Myxococcota bacterium]|nr:C2 family cysteine protease [Myxococcota bacterium]